MERRSTSQDVSWFLDLKRHNQLDLNPPYQRKSVWNPKDKRFFLDTVFRGYPSPPIFLHKTIGDSQQTIYAVVDGKQRLQTLFEFSNGDIILPEDFGDSRYAGKKWTDLGESEKQVFWNYVLPVEFLSFNAADPQEVNQAFDRLNRNMRKLEPQELRHARWDGWFITLVEAQCEEPIWRDLGVVTNSRSKRMKDAQFISELLLVIIEGRQLGFDQQSLDAAYAKFDDLDELDEAVDTVAIIQTLSDAKAYLLEAQVFNGSVKRFASAFATFYTLWAAVVLHKDTLPNAEGLATLLVDFKEKMDQFNAAEDTGVLLAGVDALKYRRISEFFGGYRGASTDLAPRAIRLEAFMHYIRGD